MVHYTYIVQCSNSGLYTGITKQLRKRIDQHNGVAWGGAYYTKMHRPVFLVHIEKFNTKKEARKRELEIQDLSHDEKLSLVVKTTKQEILSSV
jgi:putative endonuclease